jgi:predicted glutamine amidotransferase
MCIIVYKPAGEELPGTRTLKRCFEANPDGAGIMYPTRSGVRIVKGLMSFDQLTDALGRREWKNRPVVIHFRIGTHGTRSVANTHPFPVTKDESQLAAKTSSAPVALAHNGIISLTSGGGYKDDRSDTFRFVRDYASDAILGPRYYRQKKTVALLARLADSKLAIMSADGHVELIGRFEKHDGCYYSNDSYKRSSFMSLVAAADKAYTFDDDYSWTQPKRAQRRIGKTERTVSAAFVPPGYMILDERTGEVTSAARDMYCYDKLGRVYVYDGPANRLVEIEESTVVTVDMEPRVAESIECMRFSVAKQLVS